MTAILRAARNATLGDLIGWLCILALMFGLPWLAILGATP